MHTLEMCASWTWCLTSIRCVMCILFPSPQNIVRKWMKAAKTEEQGRIRVLFFFTSVSRNTRVFFLVPEQASKKWSHNKGTRKISRFLFLCVTLLISAIRVRGLIPANYWPGLYRYAYHA